MEIIKAFENNKLNIQINIKGTHENPLFRASDIGLILGHTNIHVAIKDFDSTEKVISNAYTPGGEQEVTFLTEKGLYQLLFTSKKPIAKTFKNWVCEVIKEIRLNNVYNLEKQLENTNEKLALKDREIENSLISNFKNRHAFYLILVEKDIIKFGFTKDIEKRLKDHKTEFGSNIMLKMVIETIHNRELEQMVKLKLQHVIIEKKYKNNQTELIQLSKEFTYEDLKVKIEEIDTSTIPELIKENTELKLKLAEYEIIIKNYELIKRNIELNKLTEPVKIPQVIKQNQERIQLYDPSNLKLIKTYETMQDACDETEYYKDAVPQSIYRSIKNNTLYKNYRFWGIKRSQPIKEYSIPENYELSKEQTYQRVVQVKNDEVIGVFSCTKNASEYMFDSIKSGKIVLHNKKLSNSTVSQINKSITNSLSVHTNHHAYEHHWYRESDIPENLLQSFGCYKLNNVLPNLSVHKNNKKVYKFDTTGVLVHTYNSITEARKTEGLSEKSIQKYIDEKVVHNSHIYTFELK